MANDDLSTRINEVAADPSRAKGDQGEMENPSLRDLIDADRHLASKRAASHNRVGLRFYKIKPPGASE